MGAWGGLVIFDCKKYQDEIIPALISGAEHPLVKIEIEKIKYQNQNLSRCPDYRGIENIFSTFDENLKSSPIGKDFVYYNGKIISSPQNLDYQKETYIDYWDLTHLYESIISRNCFEVVTNFGLRNISLNFFSDIQNELGKKFVNLLSSNANYWQHAGGGYREGIHGWLNIEETKTFATMVDGIEPHDNYLDDQNLPIRLKSFKWMVKEAARLNKGILWGADLKILYVLKWRNKKLGSIVRINQEVRDCLNTINEEDGETVEI